MNSSLFEWIGYSASIFVVLSFVVNQLFWVRLINMIGCMCFVVYGVYFEAWPVVIPNAIVAFIQIYYLVIADKKTRDASS